MNNPTKIAKYSGTKVPYIGMFVLYLPDGTVTTLNDVFAGVVCKTYKRRPKNLKFWVPKEGDNDEGNE